MNEKKERKLFVDMTAKEKKIDHYIRRVPKNKTRGALFARRRRLLLYSRGGRPVYLKMGGQVIAPVIIFATNRVRPRYYIILRHTFNPYATRRRVKRAERSI
jgi:hypothetical protein